MTTTEEPTELRDRLLAGVPVTEHRLELAGIPTAVLEGGEGPPVVLLHGPGESVVKWKWVLPRLVGRCGSWRAWRTIPPGTLATRSSRPSTGCSSRPPTTCGAEPRESITSAPHVSVRSVVGSVGRH